jgi:hypothetical protein
MAKTKASERIRLVNGDVMTLGDAVTLGRVRFYVGGDNGGLYLPEKLPPSVRPRAWMVRDGDSLWVVSRSFFESRTGLPISAARKR